MNRTKQLAQVARKVYNQHKDIVDSLPTRGPKRGTNAANIKGWHVTGNATITRACNIAGVPTMNYWSGRHPTPSAAIPSVMVSDMTQAYNKIFKKNQFADK